MIADSPRNRVIGRLLLGAAEEWVKDEGVDLLRVRSRSNRTESHAFFQRAGFGLTKNQRLFDRSYQLEF